MKNGVEKGQISSRQMYINRLPPFVDICTNTIFLVMSVKRSVWCIIFPLKNRNNIELQIKEWIGNSQKNYVGP